MRRAFGVIVDGRSRDGAALRRFYQQLVDHVGGQPSIIQQTLIASICQLRLRLLALDRSFLETGRMTETESRHYRGWVSTYHASLRDLGLEASQPRRPDIREIMAKRAAGGASVRPIR